MTCYVTVSTDSKIGICLGLYWNWYLHLKILYLSFDERLQGIILSQFELEKCEYIYCLFDQYQGIYRDRQKDTHTEKDMVRETRTYTQREKCIIP